jgi:hypothetical protein
VSSEPASVYEKSESDELQGRSDACLRALRMRITAQLRIFCLDSLLIIINLHISTKYAVNEKCVQQLNSV